MSIAPAQPDLVLTRRFADGTVEWIPLQDLRRVEVDPGADYALIDRANYEAPRILTARREADDLVIEASGVEALVLGGFFAAAGAAFYPTTNIAGGAGPFSGTSVTSGSRVPTGSPEGEGVVWSSGPAEVDVPADVAATSGASAGSPLLWGGLAAGGLGLALAAGGGGGGSGGASTVATASASTSTSTSDSSNDSSSVGTGGSSDATTTETSPPQITSSATANPVDENDGAGLVVYTATASGSVAWSLAGVDAEAFAIDSETGVVTLIGNADYETQPAYTFAVVATDDEGNRSEQVVTLAVNDLDEVAPVVSAVALTGASGARSGILNAGDTVTVTVTMSERVDVQTSGGGPRVALSIGGSTVYAEYVSGSGSSSLTFEYTIRPGDTDDDGIRIQRNGLELNGARMTDAAGNAADLAHDSVGGDDAYRVDTTAPAIVSTNPGDGARNVDVDDDIVLRFDEDIVAGNGSITVSNGSDIRIIDVTDGSQVRISGNRLTIDPDSDLIGGSTYNVQIDGSAITDDAGNAFVGIDDSTTLNFDTERSVDATVVVFDLVGGESSDHSGRSFDEDVTYDIYILVESDDNAVRLDGRDRWEGAANLGGDDRVILVGDGSAISGPFFPVDDVSVTATAIAWESRFGADVARLEGRTFSRITGLRGGDADDARLFETALPTAFLENQGGQLSTMYLTSLPAGILTSQGLA